MPVLRELAVGASEAALPGDQKPPGTSWTGPRPGTAPLALDWYVVFVDGEGRQISGGSAYVQWYAVEFAGAAVNTPVAVAGASSPALTSKRVVVGPGIYAWPIVSYMTPPTVPDKATQVNIADDGDGTYAVVVVGEEDPYEFEAVGKSLGEITDGLAALFGGHPTLTVVTAGDGYLLFSGAVDFELVLESPDDTMSQSTYVDYSPPVAKMLLYATASAGVAADVGFSLASISTAMSAALQAAGATAQDTAQAVQAGLSYAANNGVIPSDADVVALAAATQGPSDAYGGAVQGAGLQSTFVADGSSSSRVAVYGWLATGGATAIDVQLLSGAPGDTSPMKGPGNGSAPAKAKVGAGSAVNMSSGAPLWYSENGRGVVFDRSSDQPIQVVVWYRLVPNA